MKANSAGNLTKTYSVDSSVKPLDSEGREWLDRLLPQLIREVELERDRGSLECFAEGGAGDGDP